MTRISIAGANGRMGQYLMQAVLQDPDSQLGAALVRNGSALAGKNVAGIAESKPIANLYTSDWQDVESSQVLIDFTLPQALDANLSWCVRQNIPLVIGTTGLSESQQGHIKQAAESIPIVFAANYSVGVNLLLNLVHQTAKTLDDSYDIEIQEAHHRYKVDAPSGTALALGEAAAKARNTTLQQSAVYHREGHTGERQVGTIGFATVRGGDIVGEHTAYFMDKGERLELTHKASSRMTFASGALRAAKWLVDQPPSLYDMQDVLGLK
jgi:4-hydroxy-tetrahydrodipicolinate reductase